MISGPLLSRFLALFFASTWGSGALPVKHLETGDVGPSSIHELHIDVDGLTIRALCTDGRRQVVLMHGEGSSAEDWRPVLERLDGVVGACAYDRSGNGESTPKPASRGWYELLDELRRVHLALGFDRGYVVAAHSLGGLYARLYATDRPRDISGLVLVDPAHEDMPQKVRTGMPEQDWNAWVWARGEPNQDGVAESVVGDRLRNFRLPEIPVTVITATIRQDGDGWDARFINEAARQVHASILQGVMIARHVPASRSGYDVHLDQPQLVADEIFRMVRATRR